MTIILLVTLPVLAALVSLVIGWRTWMPGIGAIANLGVLVGGIVFAVHDLHDAVPVAARGNLRVDSLSAFMLIVIGAVSTLASWGAVRYLGAEVREEHTTPRHAVLFAVLVQLFVGAMVLAVCAANIGILW